MLRVVVAASVDELVNQIVPADIRLSRPLALPEADTEFGYFQRLREIAGRNRVCRSYLGLGYHDTITPAVILRNVFENPGWYTPYTPYQAEIGQGRLESLLNYQTMVSELTGMEVANASLLDEATAAAEAMTMLMRVHKQAAAKVFLVSDRVFPQVRAVLETRAAPLGIELRVSELGSSERDSHTLWQEPRGMFENAGEIESGRMVAHWRGKVARSAGPVPRAWGDVPDARARCLRPARYETKCASSPRRSARSKARSRERTRNSCDINAGSR